MGSRNTYFVLCFLINLLMTSVFAQPRIAGGQRAKLGQFKFVVALEMRTVIDDTNAARSTCSGSLLSETWVISAAHCLGPHVVISEVMGIKKGARTLVLAGDLDAEKAFKSQTTTGQMRLSFQNYTHPDAYDLGNLKLLAKRIPEKTFLPLYWKLTPFFTRLFDIALFELQTPFSFGTDIASIKLAKYYNWGYQQGKCVAIGFGTKNYSHPQQLDLNYIPVHVGGLNFCKSAEHNFTFNLEYIVCVRGKKEFMNPCIGDSGGPVVCGEYGNPQFLYGVSSSGASEGVQAVCGQSKIITNKYIFPNHAADWIGWVTHLVNFQEPTSEQDDPRPAHEEFAAPADPADAAPASCGPFLAVEATLFALVVFKSSWDIINY